MLDSTSAIDEQMFCSLSAQVFGLAAYDIKISQPDNDVVVLSGEWPAGAVQCLGSIFVMIT